VTRDVTARGHLRLHSPAMATKHVAVRLDEQTLARVDALIPVLSTAWHRAKRSEVLRALLHAGLETDARGGPVNDGGAAPRPPG